MKSSSLLIPVVFLAFLFVLVLPRLLRTQTAIVQILPPTSITPAAPRASARVFSASHSAQAADASHVSARLPEEVGKFAAPYLNGKPEEAVAVAVEGRFSLPVVQQPKDQPAFVSSERDVITQFSLPRQYGTTGLLAHNFLSGKLFSEIQIGDVVSVVYGDGSAAYFQVDRIESYQALSPNSPYSQFIDLNSPNGGLMTSASLFNRIYTHPDRVVFQTCIAYNGEPSWGRLFISASRISLFSQIPAPEQSVYSN